MHHIIQGNKPCRENKGFFRSLFFVKNSHKILFFEKKYGKIEKKICCHKEVIER